MTKGDLRWIENWQPKGDNMHIGTIKSPKWDTETEKLNNPLLHKLLKLKYRINDMYRNGGPGVDTDMTRADKTWVMNLISDVRNNNLTKLSKEDILHCNGLWRTYEGK